MSDSADTRLPTILQSPASGQRQEASDELLPLVYVELRRVAHAMIQRERPGQTLQPTALVHEAYLRVAGSDDKQWDGRKHFFGAATEAMRRILIERARGRATKKRGGDVRRRHGVTHRLQHRPAHEAIPAEQGGSSDSALCDVNTMMVTWHCLS